MLAQSLMVIIAEKVVLRQGHGLRWSIWCAEEARLRLLRARVNMAGHDSLCLLPAPELFLCGSHCDMTPSRLLESGNGRRNFQDGISICQEAEW